MDALEKLVQAMNGLTWESLAWLAGAIIVLVGIKRVAKKGVESLDAWMALPTLDQYWELHPNSKTDSGPKCYKCSSKNFRNVKGDGLAGDDDRTIICRLCGTVLYRIAGDIKDPLLRAIYAKHAPGKSVEEAWRAARNQVAKK